MNQDPPHPQNSPTQRRRSPVPPRICRRIRRISIPPPSMPTRMTKRGCPRSSTPAARRCRRPARGRPRRDRTRGAPCAHLARRLPHAECGERRALCRQGQECPQAAHLLCAADRPGDAHRPHDRGHRGGGNRLDHDRDRGAAARSQSDQAAAAALQRAAARRQIVPLYSHYRRSLGAADSKASRRADAARALFRAVRLRGRCGAHHHGAAARVSGALLHRFVLRKPHPAVPAVSNPALLGSLHRRDRFPRLYRTGARGDGVLVRPQPAGEAATGRRNGEGLGGAGVRERGTLPRPARGVVGGAVAAGHQSAHRRGGRRVRHPSGGRLFLRRGVLLPHRPELGQPRVFSARGEILHARGGIELHSSRNSTTTSRRRN